MRMFISLLAGLTAVFLVSRAGLLNYDLEPTTTAEPTPIITPSPLPIILSGYASYYDKSVCGEREYGVNCKTASGEIFNEDGLTVANKSLKFGTVIEFEYKGKKVECRVNDRGPFIDGREFDLSKGCADALNFRGVGKVNYHIRKEVK